MQGAGGKPDADGLGPTHASGENTDCNAAAATAALALPPRCPAAPDASPPQPPSGSSENDDVLDSFDAALRHHDSDSSWLCSNHGDLGAGGDDDDDSAVSSSATGAAAGMPGAGDAATPRTLAPRGTGAGGSPASPEAQSLLLQHLESAGSEATSWLLGSSPSCSRSVCVEGRPGGEEVCTGRGLTLTAFIFLD